MSSGIKEEDGGERFWLHVGDNDGAKSADGKWDEAQFSNLFEDTRKTDGSKKLFDLASSANNNGRRCAQSAPSNTTHVITWRSDWSVVDGDLLVDPAVSKSQAGQCLIGKGHLFCTKSKRGQSYTNAVYNNCGAVGQSTFVWSFESSNFGCGGYAQDGADLDASQDQSWYKAGNVRASTPKLVGTGCKSTEPAFRYNMLLVY